MCIVIVIVSSQATTWALCSEIKHQLEHDFITWCCVLIIGFCLNIGFLMCADMKLSAESSEPAASAAAAAGSSSPLSAPDSGAVVKRHKAREHKRVYRCSLCNKVFQNSSNLNRHIRSHGAWRPEKQCCVHHLFLRHHTIQMQLNLEFSVNKSRLVYLLRW